MRILICEDSALLREGLVRVLEDAGHEVVAALPDASDLDVAVDDDIFLAFVARLAEFLGLHLAIGDVVLVGDGLGANEAALEVGVNDTGRLRRLGALHDRPGAGLLRADGEIGLQAQQPVAGGDHPIQPALVQAEPLEDICHGV